MTGWMTRSLHALAIAGSAALATGAALGAFAPSFSGPPLICIEYECDASEQLPMGDGPLQPRQGYDRDRLVPDAIRHLDGATHVIERMETIRRAAIYANRSKDASGQLMSRLAWRALDAESTGDRRAYADALFDAGFFAATIEQLDRRFSDAPGRAAGIAGFAWIGRAADLTGDPAMHFAAAIAAHPVMNDSKRALFERHIVLAAPGAEADPVLANNLQTHLEHYGDSLDRILRNAERRRDGDPG